MSEAGKVTITVGGKVLDGADYGVTSLAMTKREKPAAPVSEFAFDGSVEIAREEWVAFNDLFMMPLFNVYVEYAKARRKKKPRKARRLARQIARKHWRVADIDDRGNGVKLGLTSTPTVR